jgi:flagellin-like hook-associated protein FlgL
MEVAMALSIVSNVAALATTHTVSRTNDATVGSLRRLSSGYRITRAADDASGLSISEGLRSQIGGMKQAVRNAQDGVSVLQIADGALDESASILQRMRTLSLQAANEGGLNSAATSTIQKEIDQLKLQLDSIAAGTSFNGTKLLDGTYDRLFQVGETAGQTIRVTIGGSGFDVSTHGLGLDAVDVTGSVTIPSTVTPAVSAAEGVPSPGVLTLAGDYVTPGVFENNFRALAGTVTYNGKSFDLGSVDYTGAVTATDYIGTLDNAAVAALGTGFIPFTGSATGLLFTAPTPGPASTHADAVAMTPTYTGRTGPDGALTVIDQALTAVTSLRTDLGALMNRFQHTIDRLDVSIEATTASESRIRDTDMATETVTYSRAQILTQSGTAMLAQAGQSGQAILTLLG